MKIIYFFLFIFYISHFALIAEIPANGTIVSTFFLTFPPAYQESDSDSLKVSVLITSFSYYETNVAITIKSRNYQKVITIAPYSSEEVFFDIADAFPVPRKVNDTIAYENVHSGSAIKIEADNKIHCYGFVKSKNICEGFLVYPLEALNKQYIVSTLSSNNKNYPAYTAIVGTYDNTKVTFRMGGCDNCKTVGNDGDPIKAGEVIRRTINEGDVWLVPGIGDYNDLSGSIFLASKPVAVISGNYYAKTNDKSTKYNYIIEQDIPNSLYGNKFYISEIMGSKKSPLLLIYPKNPYTIIYANGKPIDTLTTPGGVATSGFSYYIPDGEFSPPLVISSDSAHPINVVLFNNNEGVYSYPFKMQMIPESRFAAQLVVQLPYFDNFSYHSNLIYKLEEGKIPKSFDVRKVVNNKYEYSTLSEYFGNDIGVAFPKIDEDEYYAKTLNFNKKEQFVFANYDKPFANYLYGGNQKSAFGYTATFDYYVNNGADKIAPYFTKFTDTCCGNIIRGNVLDVAVPNNEEDANLVRIFMNKNGSHNFKFSYDKFEMGTNKPVNWYLEVIDPSQEAIASLFFYDRSGNYTNEKVEYLARKIEVIDTAINFGKFIEIDSTKEIIKLFTVKNNSRFQYVSTYFEIYPILQSQFLNQNSNFELVNNIDITPMNINQEKSFEVKFSQNQKGHSKDSIGIAIINNICQDTCLVKFFTEISADIYDVFVQVDGVDFGEQIINSPYSSKKLTIQNPIIKPFISEQSIKIVGYEFIGDSIGDFNSNKVFKIFGIDQVSEENPITIDVGEKHLFDVYFAPDTSKTYFTNIQFKILTDISAIFITEPDHEAIITGIAKIGTSAEDNVYSGDILISPNPASEYITINYNGINPMLKHGVDGDVMVAIYDVMGIMVAQTPSSVLYGISSYGQTGTSNLPRIDVSHLAPGVYFVKIIGSNGGYSIVEKFVKM